MHLKWHELKDVSTDGVAKELARLYDLRYYDIMDEIDEIFRHKYQLIYACGSCQALPSGRERWEAVQLVLERLQTDADVAVILAEPQIVILDRCSTALGSKWVEVGVDELKKGTQIFNMAALLQGNEFTKDELDKFKVPDLSYDCYIKVKNTYFQPGGTARAGAFDRIPLLPGAELERHRASLIQKLAQSVLENPSHRMRWMAEIDHGVREQFVRFVTDPTASLEELGIEMKGVFEGFFASELDTKYNQLLALRGLLAYGILEHGLTRRHRVDFGINRTTRNGFQNRRVAITFRACDTPAERSEYAHPDILILLTQLAYYDDGLSEKELKEAVQALLLTGPVAQETEYKSWFDLSASEMSKNEKDELDSVKKSGRLKLSHVWAHVQVL